MKNKLMIWCALALVAGALIGAKLAQSGKLSFLPGFGADSDGAK